jgi:cation:H+ antiporter
MIWIELAAGLVLLLGGGEILVKGSVAVASRLGVSPLVIGLTLVGFGTSAPELVASVEAALLGAPGIAIGNVVGSNIANVLLILGVSAVILPIVTTKESLRRDGTVLIGTSVLMLLVVLGGTLSRPMGLVFLCLLAVYVIYTYLGERRATGAAGPEPDDASGAAPGVPSVTVGLLLAFGGIVGVVLGAGLLVDAAIAVAERAGISQAVIGLTLVAIGTSLPELATTVMAALRRHGDVAFGNAIGSCIFNVLGIAGVTAVVTPIVVPVEIVRFDIWVLLATACLLVAFAFTGWRLTRVEGAVLLATYAAYLAAQLSPAVRGALGLA